jgi:hypothetical protein
MQEESMTYNYTAYELGGSWRVTLDNPPDQDEIPGVQTVAIGPGIDAVTAPKIAELLNARASCE